MGESKCWFGNLFFWMRGLLMERAMYVCNPLETTPHSVPVPKIYVPLAGELSVETKGWTAHSEMGRETCLPTSDRKHAGVVRWTPCSAVTRLKPGQLVFVKSGFTHKLVGEGKVAILFLTPDSVEGQWALARGDYNVGLAVTDPPAAERDGLVRIISSLLYERHAGVEKAANEAYEKIASIVVPPSGPRRIMPFKSLKAARQVRAVCRPETFEKQSHQRITLKPMARLLKLTPEEVESIFREDLLARPCSYVPFLRNSAAILYFAVRKRQARLEHKVLEIGVEHLAEQVWYKNRSQFSKQFRRLHGITASTFISSDTGFFPINLDPD